MSSFGFFGIAIDNSGDLFIENSIVDIGLFWVEILVEGGSDNTVVINLDSKLGGDGRDVGIVFAVSTFMSEDEEISSSLNILDETVDFIGREWVFGGGEDEEVGLFDFFEFDWILVQTNLNELMVTL